MNKAASHELPTLPDLYLLLGGYCSIMGPATGGSQAQKVSCTLLNGLCLCSAWLQRDALIANVNI